ncbi:Annexin [Gonapodya prolifera JEL478]|uniref:Annexin n=1 Tax=Gonapodya prolifera (strain JEL478) TaxID=1344416 RepID=A0A139AWZ8_GONPJ|nr:Annexin [Gonapodya prolifera JEL478]|eukprot:KXS21266.1 Annexin [Gonapodya prolifera JEL478]
MQQREREPARVLDTVGKRTYVLSQGKALPTPETSRQRSQSRSVSRDRSRDASRSLQETRDGADGAESQRGFRSGEDEKIHDDALRILTEIAKPRGVSAERRSPGPGDRPDYRSSPSGDSLRSRQRNASPSQPHDSATTAPGRRPSNTSRNPGLTILLPDPYHHEEQRPATHRVLYADPHNKAPLPGGGQRRASVSPGPSRSLDSTHGTYGTHERAHSASFHAIPSSHGTHERAVSASYDAHGSHDHEHRASLPDITSMHYTPPTTATHPRSLHPPSTHDSSRAPHPIAGADRDRDRGLRTSSSSSSSSARAAEPPHPAPVLTPSTLHRAIAARDRPTLIALLCRTPPDVMAAVAREFRAAYHDESPARYLRAKLGGLGGIGGVGGVDAHVLDVLEGCAMGMVEFHIKVLHESLGRFTADHDALIDVLTGVSVADLRVLKSAYQQTYSRALEVDVHRGAYGVFETLCDAIMNVDHRSAPHRLDVADDVTALYQAGEARLGKDNAAFFTILTERPAEHLCKVFAMYENKYHTSITAAIKSEFIVQHYTAKALLALVAVAVDRPAHVADSIHDALASSHARLTRLVVRYRSESDRVAIARAYARKYGRSLAEAVSERTEGEYRVALLACLGVDVEL